MNRGRSWTATSRAVLARLFGLSGDVRREAVKRELWRLAEELVVAAAATRFQRGCSHLNQSLMELGAVTCTPRNPRCAECPVSRWCEARRTGRVGQLPNLHQRPATTPRRFAAFVIEHRGRFLVRQRPAGVVNALLWEFPNAEVFRPAFALRKLVKAELGFAPGALKRLCTVKHSITRYRITLEAYRGEMRNGTVKAAPGSRWLRLKEMSQLTFASAHRRILRGSQPAESRPTAGRADIRWSAIRLAQTPRAKLPCQRVVWGYVAAIAEIRRALTKPAGALWLESITVERTNHHDDSTRSDENDRPGDRRRGVFHPPALG